MAGQTRNQNARNRDGSPPDNSGGDGADRNLHAMLHQRLLNLFGHPAFVFGGPGGLGGQLGDYVLNNEGSPRHPSFAL